MAKYIPRKGDLVYLSFSPQSGHEQKGHRPALVLSSYQFNQKTGLSIVCPITHTDRGFPFHLEVKHNKIKGFAMVDQMRSIDFMARKVKFIATTTPAFVNEVVELLNIILEAN